MLHIADVRCIQYDGEATLLVPPEPITSISPFQSEMSSTLSTNSSCTIPYQRPSSFQGNQSLTDLRSMQTTLRNSLAVSSRSSMSMSTISSEVTGIGYLSGRAIKWVGMQILDGLVPLEIRRRRWAIRKLVKQIANIPDAERAQWLVANETRVNRSLEDLLELSGYVSFRIDLSCWVIWFCHLEIPIAWGTVPRRLCRGYLFRNHLNRVTWCRSMAQTKPLNCLPWWWKLSHCKQCSGLWRLRTRSPLRSKDATCWRWWYMYWFCCWCSRNTSPGLAWPSTWRDIHHWRGCFSNLPWISSRSLVVLAMSRILEPVVSLSDTAWEANYSSFRIKWKLNQRSC